MFGSGNLAAMLGRMKQGVGRDQKQQMVQRREDILGEAPDRAPRWANALQGVGATLQDVQAAGDGRQGGAVDRFSQAQERMRQARRDYDQRSRRFEQLSRNIPQSDQQFWNAYALGGEEAAMNVLNSRSDRKYDSQVRQEDRGFRQSMAQADRDFRAEQGGLDRGLRRSEGEANRRAQLESRLNTAVVANARQAAGLGPNDPLNQEARDLIRQQISREDISTSDLMLMANLGLITEEDLRERLGLGGGGDEIEAIAGALGSQ